MMKLLCTAVFAALVFTATEGFTSQVRQVDSGESFSDVFKLATDIVVAKRLDKTEIYREEIIPVKGKKDEIYTERVDLFEVTAVIKPGSIKPGQIIKVWTAPTFDYEMTKMYHQTGISKSPYIQKYTPMNPVKEGEERILYLNDKEPEKFVYKYRAAEGIASRQAVETMPLNDEIRDTDSMKAP